MSQQSTGMGSKRPVNGCLVAFVLGVLALLGISIGELYFWNNVGLVGLTWFVFVVIVFVMSLAKITAIKPPSPM